MLHSETYQDDIVVVDDTPENLNVLRQILTTQGYRVRPVLNGEMALRSIEKALPDLVLLDIMMPPGMDGYEVCRRLKADERFQDTPVVFISAFDGTIDKLKAFEAGGVDYISKPIQTEEVLARVKTHLNMRNMQKQLQQRNVHLQQEIVKRKQTEDTLHHRNRELSLLNRVSQMFSSSLELKAVLRTALEEIQGLLNVSAASIWLLESDTKGLVCMQAIGPGSENVTHWRLSLGQGLTGWVVQHGESVVVADTWSDERHFKGVDQKSDFTVRSIICIPLQVKGKIIGVFNLVDSKIGHFTQNDLRMLEPLVAAAAIAIENARLYTEAQQEIVERRRAESELRKTKDALEISNQELHRLATLDGLTQIANRRRFDEYFMQEWKRAAREQFPLSLLLGDIDYFKRYNDTYGHQAGDECLQQVAHAMDAALKRTTDLVARYGGEEFGIILPNTDGDGAMHIAQMIQQAVQELHIPHRQSSADEYVTLSLGCASTIPQRSDLSEALVAAADKALYKAKQQGRNCIVMKKCSKILNSG